MQLFAGKHYAFRQSPSSAKCRAHKPAVHVHAVTSGTKNLRERTTVDLEHTETPLNTHNVKGGKFPPFKGKVLSVERLGGRDKERDVTHIVIDTGGVVYHEGQSFGVQPPGTKVNSRGVSVPNHVRLYSIAASRYGDSRDGRTTTLCVVRVVYKDAEGKEVRGLCSNYLADTKPGDELTMTGPSGAVLLLPEQHFEKKTPIVCVSTGTGIAPFRSFWRRLFYDAVPGHEDGFQGKFWLLAGFANEDSVLYGDELRAAQEVNDNFRLDIALSLQQQNKAGGPAYVQDRIEENAEEFLQLMTSTDAQFYFCGLKRMYTSVLEVLQRIGAERGLDAQALIGKLKEEKRWHVETA